MKPWQAITVVFSIIITGCAGTKSGTKAGGGGDPLFGSTNVTPVNPVPLATNPAVSPPPNSGTLGAPTSNSQPMAQPTYASPAVLATGSYPALPGGQDLRIGTAPPPQTGNRVLPKNQTPPGVMAVVTADPDYGKPKDVPAPPGVVPLDASGNRTINPSTASTSGLDQALSNVNSMSPKWQKLEQLGVEGWRFTCSIPDRNEPNKSRTFEGEGVSALAAVHSVLERVRQER
jgi:hypothetical protein